LKTFGAKFLQGFSLTLDILVGHQ